MVAPTHILFSLSGAIALVRVHHLPFTVGDLVVVVIGSLLPDIDVDGATITRPGSVLSRVIPYQLGKLLDNLTSVVSKVIGLLFGHRGATHAPFLWLAILLYGGIAGSPLVFWLGWAALWHVIGDSLTLSGVPAFYPLSSRRYGIRLFRTGSAVEAVIAVALLWLVIWVGYPLLPMELQQGFLDLFSQAQSLLSFDKFSGSTLKN